MTKYSHKLVVALYTEDMKKCYFFKKVPIYIGSSVHSSLLFPCHFAPLPIIYSAIPLYHIIFTLSSPKNNFSRLTLLFPFAFRHFISFASRHSHCSVPFSLSTTAHSHFLHFVVPLSPPTRSSATSAISQFTGFAPKFAANENGIRNFEIGNESGE